MSTQNDAKKNDVPGWKKWLEGLRTQPTMDVEEIGLDNVKDWGIKEDGRNFGRLADWNFWWLAGFFIKAQREVYKWYQPLIRNKGKGVVVLPRVVDVGGKYLVQAKSEPGNGKKTGYLLLAPAIQASESNLQQKHGGKRPPRVELMDSRQKVRWLEMPADGGIFDEKVNRYVVINVTMDELGQLRPEEFLMSGSEIMEAVLFGDANQHLREVAILTSDIRPDEDVVRFLEKELE